MIPLTGGVRCRQGRRDGRGADQQTSARGGAGGQGALVGVAANALAGGNVLEQAEVIVAGTARTLEAADLLTLKWLILCYMDFCSINKLLNSSYKVQKRDGGVSPGTARDGPRERTGSIGQNSKHQPLPVLP